VSDPDLSRAEWRKSAASTQGDCAEVAFVAGSVLMRHSQSPSGPVLAFSPAEWAAFLAGVRNGEFDLAGNDPADGPM
jgi:Domain of unknown function (DUF397)